MNNHNRGFLCRCLLLLQHRSQQNVRRDYVGCQGLCRPRKNSLQVVYTKTKCLFVCMSVSVSVGLRKFAFACLFVCLSLQQASMQTRAGLWMFLYACCCCFLTVPEEGRGCLMPPPCLESQGCHLISLYYLLSCSSAPSCHSVLSFFFLPVGPFC